MALPRGNPLTQWLPGNSSNPLLDPPRQAWREVAFHSLPRSIHQPLPTTPTEIPLPPVAMTLHQGDCITLTSDENSHDENLYQVIGVDDRHNRCWVRRWPLASHGSPVFEISLQQVASNGHPHPPRKPTGA
ncbi:MAG: hypothetical protein RLZZ423_1640 [Cyanobacteriota bacterium]|jgi:hypothetical protein